MEIVSVAVSGAVGKQVYAAGASPKPIILKGLILTPLSANTRVTIREGNASGNIVLVHNSFSAQVSQPINLDEGKKFLTGMHVKVIGTGAVAYLLVD